ncbi:substrate-binding domain-containing protein [Bacillus sp. DTU_2020_1000418_1_SI_GHA_SEK_038]|uniref:PstS family phosphate ABC transporter substrate-binding protein n=1 Tax=Bacillus sp. DTU_2020_1000418_1_SI_GHA_SEK_038 TaxID=3077585 RepID=UPI0028F12A7B|nr:substrate-binding domain-containing protein [Bacillus sp. DTU_2020_1000418_1_SI_GHA_SEK_038]WNS76620.1 substrate-binding domain-containing protein [Bacillus sp. DTU_2020_1000418_1_SI_GHA_SEK_038]
MARRLGILFLYFGIIPFGLSFLPLALLGIGIQNIMISSLIPLIIGGAIFGMIAVKKLNQQDKLKEPLLLYFMPLLYTGVLWAIFMIISHGFYGADIWFYFGISHIAFAPIFLIGSFMGVGSLLIWAPLAYEISFLIAFMLTLLLRKERPIFKRKQWITILAVLIISFGTGATIQMHRSKTVLPSYGFNYGGGYSSTDLTPYSVSNPNHKLPKLNEESTFVIRDRNQMPILDGAEAAYPVYSAFANATYKNIDKLNYAEDIVTFTNTIYAYERMLSGEIDIYFGAEPSKSQLEMAKRAGKELVMTPIGKEAFVFFVNPDNEVQSLSVSEIQGIYSGKITNWSNLNGRNERIIAFQRPENSGSQTLLEKIMGDTPIMKPLKEEVPRGMGGIMEQVADYRNYKNAIGFSFRFFATGMNPNPDIKLIAIDGIEPNPENISSSKYPFTASLYAITLKDNPKPTIDPFLEWMKGPQGQEIVEQIGYIKLPEN